MRMKFFAVLMMLTLTLTACGSDDYMTVFNDVNTVDGVTMTLKEETLKNSKATFMITNDSAEDVLFDPVEFHLEKKNRDGVWEENIGTRVSEWKRDKTEIIPAGTAMEKDANLCKGLFRAVIFRISHYIGLKFKEMVQRELDIELECDWKIMYHNFCKEFIETEQEWENTFSEKAFLSVIAKYKDEKVHISKYEEYSIREKRKATPERISNQMRETLISKKKSVTLEAGDSDVWERRIYQFEELENELEGLFIFDSEEERWQMITNVCISNLETNSFSNYLLAKGEEQVLYRGFRYGENSEVFLHESLWFFYIFLYVYYETCPDNELVKGYDNYMRKLRNYLESKGYLNVWISEDGFEFLKKYFGKFKKDDQELITEIRRRRYLLEYDRTVMKNQIGEIFLKEAYSVLDY